MVYGKPEEGDEADLKICTKIVYDAEEMKESYGAQTEEEISENLWKKVKEINKEMPTYKYVHWCKLSKISMYVYENLTIILMQ